MNAQKTENGFCLGADECRYVRKIVARLIRAADVDDVTQNALLVAHRKRESFRGDAKPTTWLHCIAVTAALMHLRSRRRRSAIPVREDVFETLQSDRTPEDEVSDRELSRIVLRAFDALSAPERDMIRDRFVEELSLEEIARRRRMPTTTMKTRFFRARKTLILAAMAAL